MTRLKSFSFLLRYYLSNALFAKLGGLIPRHFDMGKTEGWSDISRQHSGHENWLVIGNGPSLTSQDLESLAHIPSIGSNRVNLLFETSHWRPTLYTVCDPLVLFKLPSDHYEAFDQVLLPDYGYFLGRAKKKLPWKIIGYGKRIAWLSAHTETLPDPVESGLLQGYSVTILNAQIAMWLGAKTIYLIGCDHFYNETQHSQVKKLSHEGAQNHFHPDYRKPGEIVNNAPVDRLNEDYAMIGELAKMHGVRIINITRRTALEVFERSTVENVASETRLDV